MTHTPNPGRDLTHAAWRKSSFSTDQGGECVELALLDDTTIAVRNSNHPTAGTIYLTRTEMNAWIQGVKTGELDDLT